MIHCTDSAEAFLDSDVYFVAFDEKCNVYDTLNGPNKLSKRGSCMVWEINMGVCPRLDFDNIMLFNCLGYNFDIYGAFEFLCNSIANL